MMYYKNVIILGTSHISPDSVAAVNDLILNETPDIIALELDPLRFKSLISSSKQKFHLLDIFKNNSKKIIKKDFMERKV